MDNQPLQKRYGLLTAICMVVGIVIGSGVFFKAQDILVHTNGNMPLGILAWFLGGMAMVLAILAFSVLARRYARINGIIDYAEETVGPRYGYLVGWFVTTIYYPSMTSVLAWVSARYTVALFGENDPASGITMVVAGLWHGSTLMFVLWGALHGLGLVVHKWCQRLFLHRLSSHRWWVKVPSWLLCQVFIMFTWVLFRCSDLTSAQDYLHRMFTQFDTECIPAFIAQRPLWIAILMLSILVHCLRERWFYRLQERFIQLPWPFKALALLLVLQLAIEFSSNEVQPFLYYKF